MLLELIPRSWVVLLPELSLILVGYAVEKHYVSRVTCFTNVMALAVHSLTLGNMNGWFGLYVDLGLILGGVGFLAYWERERLPAWYYEVSHFGYSSLVVGSILLYPHIEWIFSDLLEFGSLPTMTIVGIAILLNFVFLDYASELHYTGARSVDVNEFIKTAQIRYPTERGWSRFVGLDAWFDDK